MGDGKKGKYGEVAYPRDLAAFNKEALFLFPPGLLLIYVFYVLSARLAPLAALIISGVSRPLPDFLNTKKLTPCTMADVINDRGITDAELKKRRCKK